MRRPPQLSHPRREPSRIDEVTERLLDPAARAEASALLLLDPQFTRLYHERHAPNVDEASLRAFPNGSLGHQLLAFRSHYQLTENFFPIGVTLDAKTTPLDYAVYLLNSLHDLIHVVCQYDISDADEVAIESFLLAQLPIPLALFVQYCLAHPEIHIARYKHLRDMGAAYISWPDYDRGGRAETLAFANLDRRLGESVTSLRRELNVAKREHQVAFINTCGLPDTGSFWRAEPPR